MKLRAREKLFLAAIAVALLLLVLKAWARQSSDDAQRECEAQPNCHWIGTLEPGESDTVRIRIPFPPPADTAPRPVGHET